MTWQRMAQLATGSRTQSSFIPGRAIASPSHTQGGSRMRESRLYGSVRGGARGDSRPYRKKIISQNAIDAYQTRLPSSLRAPS
jgi:hypothetical protein